MSFVAVAVVGAGIGGALISSSAAGRAADAQERTSDQSIAQQQAQFAQTQELLAPYVGAGVSGIGGMLALTGGAGEEAYQNEITRVENSPEFTSMISQGEEAMLANASATGGLRGGNIQGAMAQFRPQMLAQMLDRRFGQYQDIASIGGNAATGQANLGQSSADSVSRSLSERGAATAGGALGRADAWGSFAGDVANYAINDWGGF